MNPTAVICARLRSKGIVIPQENDWLNACVQCYLSNNPHNLSLLFDFVYEQWTLADLADVASPSLPTTCCDAAKTTLTGKYAVQINYAVDVSTPFYKQLQTIRRPDSLNNVEVDCKKMDKDFKDNISSRRCFKMEITDGTTTLIGFEDVPLPMLKNPIPGEKVLLTGPFEVRRGVVALKPCNVTLLGGEVDTLLVSNAAENILARATGLPENPDPYSVAVPETDAPLTNAVHSNEALQNVLDDGEDEALSFLAEAVENETLSSQNLPSIKPQEPPPKTRLPTPKTAPAVQPSITSFLTTKRAPERPKPPSPLASDDFDDFELLAAQTASLAEQCAASQSEMAVGVKPTPSATVCNSQFNGNQYPNKRKEAHTEEQSRQKIRRNESCELFDPSKSLVSDNRVTANQLSTTDGEEYLDWIPPPQKANLSHLRNSNERGKILVDYTDPSSLDLDLLSSQSQSQPQRQQKTTHLPAIPNEEFPPKKYPCTIFARGRVVKIINKLQLKDQKWHLTAVVDVKGIQLELDFSSKALDKIFTVSAEEITRQKNLLKTDLTLKEKFNGHLRESQLRIQRLDCEMEIRFESFISNPVVVDVNN